MKHVSSASSTTRSVGKTSSTTSRGRPAAHPSRWKGDASSSRRRSLSGSLSLRGTGGHRPPRTTPRRLTCGKKCSKHRNGNRWEAHSQHTTFHLCTNLVSLLGYY